VEDTFDGGEVVFEEIGNFLDEAQVVAIYLAERKCVDVVAEKADVFQDSEAACHGMVLRTVGLLEQKRIFRGGCREIRHSDGL
jgi:hypothetical protein